MTHVTVIVDDRAISVDFKKWDDIHYDWPEKLWAIQWDGSNGQIEYRDGTTGVATIEDVQPYIDLYNAHDALMYDTRKAEETAVDAIGIARDMRNNLLSTVFDAVASKPFLWAELSAAKQNEYLSYRDALKDLPDSADWGPVMTWDDSSDNRDEHHAVLSGVVWPTEPT